MKHRITNREKTEILITKTSDKKLLISGLISSFCIIILLDIILIFTNYFINSYVEFDILVKSISYIFIFAIIGMAASKTKQYEYLQPTVLPLCYILFSATVFFIIMTEFIIAVNQRDLVYNLVKYSFKFRKIDFSFWIASSVTIFSISFAFGSSIEILWEKLFNFWISKLSNIDYRSIFNEKYFITELNQFIYNASRYGTIFSIIIYIMNDFNNLKKKFSKRALLKLQDEILDTLGENFRKTDAVGYIEESKIYAVVLQASKAQSEDVGKRNIQIINDILSKKHGKGTFTFAVEVYGYSTSWKNIDSITNEIKKVHPEQSDDIIRI